MFRYEINKQFCYVINNLDYITHTPSFPKGERCALLREGLTAYRLGSTHADYITDQHKRKLKSNQNIYSLCIDNRTYLR